MPDAKNCPHKRTRLIAEDEHEKYVECLDCGVILEAAEMKPSEKNAAGGSETLGDA